METRRLALFGHAAIVRCQVHLNTTQNAAAPHRSKSGDEGFSCLLCVLRTYSRLINCLGTSQVTQRARVCVCLCVSCRDAGTSPIKHPKVHLIT